MSEKSKTQQVVKEEKKNVAVFDNSILRKAGASLSERDAEDYQIPYLNVIVSNSPQRKRLTINISMVLMREWCSIV